MNHFSQKEIESTLDYSFKNHHLLQQAFTRSSYVNEHREEVSNEVLEFIGDSVLSLLVVNRMAEEYRIPGYPEFRTQLDEGNLSALKASLVNKKFLARQMDALGWHEWLRMSEGDRKLGTANSSSVKEDLTESIIGAIYLDCGCDPKVTAKAVSHLVDFGKFFPDAADCDVKVSISSKNDLQEYCAKHKLPAPSYNTYADGDGFTCVLSVDGLPTTAKKSGQSKKSAELSAAKAFLDSLASGASSPVSQEKSASDNYIGKLKEYCEKQCIPQPEYATISNITNSDNTHTITVSCTCLGFSAEGSGKNAQEAKQTAAKEILRLLGLCD